MLTPDSGAALAAPSYPIDPAIAADPGVLTAPDPIRELPYPLVMLLSRYEAAARAEGAAFRPLGELRAAFAATDAARRDLANALVWHLAEVGGLSVAALAHARALAEAGTVADAVAEVAGGAR